MKRRLSENETIRFIKVYPEVSNATIALEFGVKVYTISYWAKLLGLKKSPEYIATARKKGADMTNAKRWNYKQDQ